MKDLSLESFNDIYRMLPCGRISDHPLRLDFYSQLRLKELEQSISLNGLLEPLIVYEVTKGRFVILSGHYRIRAMRRLKEKHVLCRIICCDKKTAAGIYCAVNCMTRALSAMEEAHIISGLLKNEGYTLKEAGEVFGRSSSWASRRVKLLKSLSVELIKELQEGNLSPRTAQEITRLPQGNDQEKVYSIVKKNYLTKDETARLVDQWLLSDETERGKIEEDIAFHISDPERIFGAGFKQCVKIIERLLSYPGCFNPPYKYWAWEDYLDFMAATERISQYYMGSFNHKNKKGEVMAHVASLS